MKFTVSKDAFLTALDRASRALPKKSTLPMLLCVHIAATDEGLVMRGTDLYQWMTLSCPARVDKPGSLLVPAKALKERVEAMPNDDITFELKKTKFTISSGDRKHNIDAYPPDDAPPVPEFEGVSVFKGPAELLVDLLAFTAHAMSEDQSRDHLHGVLLEMDETHLRGVATDGHRMALRERTIEGGRDWSAFVPLEPAKVALKLAKELALDVEILSSSTSIAFKFGDLVFGTKVTNAKFPPYRQILVNPSRLGYIEVKAPRAALGDCVRSVALASGPKDGVVFSIADGEMTLTARSPDNGESEDQLAVECTGTAKVQVFADYLTQALGVYSTEEIALFMGGSMDVLLLGTDDARCLVMPMRL